MTLLRGTRVVVLADRLVDFGARMLSELGAEVQLADPGDGMTAPRRLAWHRGLTQTDAPLRDLLANADVLLDDRRRKSRPEVDDIAAECSRLVHVVVTGYPEGNDDDRPVTDLTLMAESGLMKVTGDPDHPPLRLPGEQAYALTGIQAATAALLGLRARRRTGKGQRIAVSALQAAALANYREPVMYQWTGRIGTRHGNRLVRGKSGVRQVWPCVDGHVTWSMIDNPAMMRALVRVMEQEGAAGELSQIDWEAILVADTDQALIDRWEGVVADFFARHTRAELEAWSLEHGWGLSPIDTLPEVLDSAHLAARKLFERVIAADGMERRLPGPLFACHPAPAFAQSAAS